MILGPRYALDYHVGNAVHQRQVEMQQRSIRRCDL